MNGSHDQHTQTPARTDVGSMPRPIHGLLILIAGAIVLRLAGYGAAWLPTVGELGVLLAFVHIADVVGRQTSLKGWQDAARANTFTIGLASIALIAWYVRTIGLGLDLGHQPLDVDEQRLAANIQHYFVTGELGHQTVEHYPGLVFWLFTAASFLGYLRDLTHGLPHPAGQVSLDLFVYASRMANVVVGVGIVILTGLVGRHLAGAAVGLLAALVVAIVPLSVDLTLVRNDPGLMLAVMAATYVALAHVDDERTTWAIPAGALAGVAAGIKYSGVFALVPVLIAAATRGPWPDRLARALRAAGAFVLAVAITNHFVWYDFPNFLQQLYDQVVITGAHRWSATRNPAAFYLMVLETFGTGWPLLLLAGAFVVHALSTRDRSRWIVISFPVLYLWFMAGRPSQLPRWVAPLLPFVAIAGSAALVSAVRAVAAWAAPRSPRLSPAVRAASVAIVVAAALWPAVWRGAVAFSRRVNPPTHMAVESWIAQHVPAGNVILLENDWLVVRSNHVVKRVPDLSAVLDGGVQQLAGYDWVVVPEPYFGNPTLRRLGLPKRFQASRSFGGSMGYDFEVYSIPRAPANP